MNQTHPDIYRHCSACPAKRRPSSAVLEFWGAPGPQFRDLHLEEGRLAARSEAARDSLAKINPARVEGLDPEDFDGFLFIGCRLRASEFLLPLLGSLPGSPGYLSSSVRALMLTRWLEGCRWYRAAREFAKLRPVFFSPAGFLNDGIVSEDMPHVGTFEDNTVFFG